MKEESLKSNLSNNSSCSQSLSNNFFNQGEKKTFGQCLRTHISICASKNKQYLMVLFPVCQVLYSSITIYK